MPRYVEVDEFGNVRPMSDTEVILRGCLSILLILGPKRIVKMLPGLIIISLVMGTFCSIYYSLLQRFDHDFNTVEEYEAAFDQIIDQIHVIAQDTTYPNPSRDVMRREFLVQNNSDYLMRFYNVYWGQEMIPTILSPSCTAPDYPDGRYIEGTEVEHFIRIESSGWSDTFVGLNPHSEGFFSCEVVDRFRNDDSASQYEDSPICILMKIYSNSVHYADKRPYTSPDFPTRTFCSN